MMTDITPLNFLPGLLEASGEGVMACNENGQTIFMNRKAREIFDRKDLGLFRPDGKTPLLPEEYPLAVALKEETVRDLEVLLSSESEGSIFGLFNGHALFDEKGTKIGAAVIFRDVSENRKNENRFRTIFEQAPISMQIFSSEGNTKYVNTAWKKLWKLPEELINQHILKDYNVLHDPQLEKKGVLPYIKKGFAGEVTVQPKIFYDPKENNLEGSPRWVDAIISPLKDSTGAVNEVVLIHVDVTKEERIKIGQEFLSQISSLLISTLDYEHLIEKLAQKVVDSFADACIIDLLENDGIRRIVSKHRIPEKQKLMDQLQTLYFPEINSNQPTMVAIRTKASLIFPRIDPKLISQYTKGPEHAELIMKIGLSSGIAVPLSRGGEVIGAITLMITENGCEYDDLDLQTANNLSQKASMAIENARLYQDLKNALRQRDEFISIVSHELKTPITSLKLQMQVASRMTAKSGAATVDSTYVKNLTDNSNRQLDRITRLVEDMLDMSRISSGRLSLNPVRVNLSELVKEVLINFKDQLEELKIESRISIEDNLYYQCDPLRMEQVITNLLSNAIRYGENKPVHIELKREENKIVLKVRDHGRGIPKEDLPLIFNRFARLSSKGDVRGMGLGLYITREILLAHHDDIHVASEAGKGTIFTVELKNL